MEDDFRSPEYFKTHAFLTLNPYFFTVKVSDLGGFVYLLSEHCSLSLKKKNNNSKKNVLITEIGSEELVYCASNQIKY